MGCSFSKKKKRSTPKRDCIKCRGNGFYHIGYSDNNQPIYRKCLECTVTN